MTEGRALMPTTARPMRPRSGARAARRIVAGARRTFDRLAGAARGSIGVGAALALLALGACTPTVVPRGPTTQAAQIDTDRIVAGDGAVLPLRSWAPATPPRAVVLALHGFADYSNGFTEPAPSWAEHGILTYAYDQRGFGKAPHFGRWAGTEAYVEDLREAVALLHARHRDTPLFVLGESMGGAIAMAGAARGALDDARGLILVAPAVRGSEAIGPVAAGLLRGLAHSVPWLAGPSGSPGIRPTDNIALLRRLSRDPLMLRGPRVDITWGLVQLMDDAVAAAPGIRLPTLVLVGARDILVPDGAMARTLARLPAAGPDRRRVAIYDNGWHMLLRDLDAARVHGDVAHWIATRSTDPASPLPSGADRQAGWTAPARTLAEP
ncbi:MAG: lysophospholipase [Alphaproteobacteria bacterium]|nr:lysophospholipase [Alphaproteobacteria bacterium]